MYTRTEALNNDRRATYLKINKDTPIPERCLSGGWGCLPDPLDALDTADRLIREIGEGSKSHVEIVHALATHALVGHGEFDGLAFV